MSKNLFEIPLSVFITIFIVWTTSASTKPDAAALAQVYGKTVPVVTAQGGDTIIAEAEEFQVQGPHAPGWQAQNWGSNYYAATFSNTFLSRKAYLSAPEQCAESKATRQIRVSEAGRYAVLVRYEAAYRFQTRFQIQIHQHGRLLFTHQYGARENVKIWAYGHGPQPEIAWPWGAVENMVWEGDSTFVHLQPGIATLTLVAAAQPAPAARRNIDLVLLTSDLADVQHRIKKEGYLPLDGLLTQTGDLYAKVHNHRDDSVLVLTIPNGTEHSPYWVHMRHWKPQKVLLEPRQHTEWIEVGNLLDTLNDGQWKLRAKGYSELDYTVEFSVKQRDKFKTLNRFRSTRGSMILAYDANTRYTQRIRLQDEVLFDLVAYLKAHPVKGKRPVQTPVFAYTFDPQPENGPYTKARSEFLDLMPLTLTRDQKLSADMGRRGYIDLRGKTYAQLETSLKELTSKGVAENVAVVSLGDEISLKTPPAEDHEGFRAWLQIEGIALADVVQEDGSNWNNVMYQPQAETSQSEPHLFYYSQRYRNAYGLQQLKTRTALIRQYLPHAGIGANFSPHHGRRFYLGETHKWVTLFRQGGMTMPWSEDYFWQVPVGTPQMNFISLDLFRAGLKNQPNAKIHYYVMAHWPGNTPRAWRRQFYGDLAHGMKIVNLYEQRPVQAAYTENHVSLPEMYLNIRRALYELGTFEDIVQDGQVQAGMAALWFSETGDAWDNIKAPFGAGKRSLYIAIRHQQLPLDVVTDADAVSGDLKTYRILYLTDQHVSLAASAAIATWVANGGRLFATAGAGMFDEFNEPNPVLRQLLGIEEIDLEVPEVSSVTLIKQDLPYTPLLDTVTWPNGDQPVSMPVFAARSPVRVSAADVQGTFQDGTAAITVNRVGKGQALYCGFLPGLTYFYPAIPRRVLDRGATDESMSHFIPTQFDANAGALIGALAADVVRPVVSSEPLVATSIIQASSGIVIPAVNWSGGPIKGLRLAVDLQGVERKAHLASGQPVQMIQDDDKTVFRFDLEVADALILR